MTVYEKMVEIGKNLKHNTYFIFTMNGETGRIIDYTNNLKDARSYEKLGAKNNIHVYIAEYDPHTSEVCFDF